MSPLVDAFLRSTVLPAALLAPALFFIGGGKDPMRQRLQAVSVALAFVLGAFMLVGRFNVPPYDASESMSVIALLLALFVAVSPKDVRSRYATRAIFVLVIGAVLLWHIRASLSNSVHMRNMLAFFCLALGVWSIVERSARQVSLPSLILLPMIAASSTSFLLLFSASGLYSQLTTVLCGLLGAALVLALLKPERVSAYALLPFVSVFVIVFMALGHFYLDVNPWKFIYLCWPFAVLWIRNWIPAPKGAWGEAAVLGILSAAPLAYYLFTEFKAAGPLY